MAIISHTFYFHIFHQGNLIDCKACILGGTDLELLNSAGCTAAHAAATNMHLDLLKVLNEKGTLHSLPYSELEYVAIEVGSVWKIAKLFGASRKFLGVGR